MENIRTLVTENISKNQSTEIFTPSTLSFRDISVFRLVFYRLIHVRNIFIYFFKYKFTINIVFLLLKKGRDCPNKYLTRKLHIFAAIKINFPFWLTELYIYINALSDVFSPTFKKKLFTTEIMIYIYKYEKTKHRIT